MKKSLLIYLLIALTSLGAFITINNMFFKKNVVQEDLSIVYYDTTEADGNCKMVEVNENPVFFQYSFDDGLTWNLDNKYLSCITNEQINLKVRNTDYDVVATGVFIIDSSDSIPSITIDSLMYIEVGSEFDLMSGVKAMDGNYDITDKVTNDSENFDFDQIGEYEITYSVTDDDGNVTTAKRVVNIIESSTKVLTEFSLIDDSLICYIGEEKSVDFESTIDTANSKLTATVDNSGYVTVNIDNALEIKDSTIKINCNKVGTATVTVNSANGLSDSIKVTVANKEVKQTFQSTIAFDKGSYTCNLGETINTIVKASNSYGTASITSYSSNDSSIVSINKTATNTASCFGCQSVQIKCNKIGTASVTAVSSDNVSAKVTVKVNDPGSITFDKTSYSCKVGETINAVITANSTTQSANVLSYSSKDNYVATISKNNTIAASCDNCALVQINCLKTGDVELSATSSTGVNGSAKVGVSSNAISFTKSNYSCTVGQTLKIRIEGAQYSELDLDKLPIAYTTVYPDARVIKYFVSDVDSATSSDCVFGNCIYDTPYVSVYCNNAGSSEVKVYMKNGDYAITQVSVSEALPGSKTDTIVE
ncbi:MAG: DUF5011 domain-containing protein [Bacilli bacterium]|nr:DUF5011 domain-containing protein [Bacilli bacterium]